MKVKPYHGVGLALWSFFVLGMALFSGMVTLLAVYGIGRSVSQTVLFVVLALVAGGGFVLGFFALKKEAWARHKAQWTHVKYWRSVTFAYYAAFIGIFFLMFALVPYTR